MYPAILVFRNLGVFEGANHQAGTADADSFYGNALGDRSAFGHGIVFFAIDRHRAGGHQVSDRFPGFSNVVYLSGSKEAKILFIMSIIGNKYDLLKAEK